MTNTHARSVVLAALLGASLAAAAPAQTLTPGNLLLTATNPATGTKNIFLLDASTGSLLSLHAGPPLASPRHMASVTSVRPHNGRAHMFLADGVSTHEYRLTETQPALHVGAWTSPSAVASVISWDEARRISDDYASLFTLNAHTQIEDDLFMFHDARQRFGSPYGGQQGNAVASLTATSLLMLNPSNFGGHQHIAIDPSQMSGPHGPPLMSTIGSVAGVNDGRWSVAVLFGLGSLGEPAALRVFDEGVNEFVTILSGGPLTYPRAISPVLVTAYDDGFYVANASTGAPGSVGEIIKVNGDGTHSVVTSGGFLMSPVAMVVDDDGFIIVADEISLNGHGSIIRVNPTTGAQAEIRGGSDSSGFSIPTSLSILRCDVPVWTVTRDDDALNANPGNGSPNAVGGGVTIRSAITEANLHPCGGAIVRVPSGTATINRFGSNEDNNLTGDIDVHAFVRIRGAGMNDTIINMGTSDRAFDAQTDGALFLSELAVHNGDGSAIGGDGGGVRSRGSVLALRRIRVESCFAVGGGGVGVLDAAAIVRDCEFVGNTSTGNGGGVLFSRPFISDDPLPVVIVERTLIQENTTSANGGGGFVRRADVTFRNCTFIGNASHFSGGGVALNIGELHLDHCTITQNFSDTPAAGTGGGGVNVTFASAIIGNSIVFGNTSNIGAPDIGQGNPADSHIFTAGYNLIGTEAVGVFTGDTSTHIVGMNPNLGPLADNGGHTRTCALQLGSPAIDHADPASAATTDQRGVARPIDGNFSGVARADIGAYERIPTCQGDVNGDGVIDFTDFSAVLNNYGIAGLAIYGDVNGDNIVDFTDFSIVLSVYGTPCP